jgi:hypothetical protein
MLYEVQSTFDEKSKQRVFEFLNSLSLSLSLSLSVQNQKRAEITEISNK